MVAFCFGLLDFAGRSETSMTNLSGPWSWHSLSAQEAAAQGTENRSLLGAERAVDLTQRQLAGAQKITENEGS